jgi:hypothetical protein
VLAVLHLNRACWVVVDALKAAEASETARCRSVPLYTHS